MSRGTRDVKTLVNSQRGTVFAAAAQPRKDSSVYSTNASAHGGSGGNSSINSSNSNNAEAEMLVSLLKDKVFKQKDELDNRTDNINAIQRNFERLSHLYDGEKSEYSRLREKFAEAIKEIDHLRAELKLNLIIHKEYEKLKSDFAALLQHTESSQEVLITELDVTQPSLVQSMFEVEWLKSQNLLQKAESAQLESELRSEIGSLQKENSVWQTQLQEETTKVYNCQQNLIHLEAKIQKLESMLQLSKNDTSRAQEDYGQQQLALQQSQAAIAALNEKIRMEQGANCQLESQLQNKEKALRDLREMWEGAQKTWDTEKHDLNEIILQLKKELTATQDELDICRRSYESESQQKSDKFKLLNQEYIQQKELLQKQIQELNLQVQKLLEELASSKEQLRRKSGELDHERSRQNLSSQQLAQQISGLHQEIESLQSKLTTSALERQCLLAQVKQLTAKLEQRTSNDVSEISGLQFREVMLKAFVEQMWELIETTLFDVKAAWYMDSAGTTFQAQKLQRDLCSLVQDIKEGSRKVVMGLMVCVQQLQDERLALIAQHGRAQETMQKELSQLKEVHQTTIHRMGELAQQNEGYCCKIQLLESTRANLQEELALQKKKSQEDLETITALKILQSEKDNRLEEGMRKLKALQQGALVAVRKLIAAEEASESGYTCLACMNIFSKPMICVPCGHTFCAGCVTENRKRNDQQFCPECHEYSIETVIPSETLEMLSGKFIFRKQVLKDLATEIMQKT